MARLYRSNAPTPKSAWAAMLLAGAGAAMVLACTWPLLGSVGSILLAGTVVRGLAIGGLLTLVIGRARFSRPRAAAAIAMVATLAALVGSHYVEFRMHRDTAIAEAEELRNQSLGYGSGQAEVDEFYQQSISELTFVNYVRRYFGFEGRGIDGAAQMWGPWAGVLVVVIEVLAALAISALFPEGQASEPACKRCGRWLRERSIGTAAYGASALFTKRLIDSDLPGALETLQSPDTREHVQFSIAECSVQSHRDRGAVLRLRDFRSDSKSRKVALRKQVDLEVEEPELKSVAAHLGALST